MCWAQTECTEFKFKSDISKNGHSLMQDLLYSWLYKIMGYIMNQVWQEAREGCVIKNYL